MAVSGGGETFLVMERLAKDWGFVGTPQGVAGES